MTAKIRIEPDGITVTAQASDTILQAARRAGVELAYECGWGSCSTCKITLEQGKSELIFPAAPAVSPRDARRKRILACQSRAVGDITVKRGPGQWQGATPRCREQSATLVSAEQLAPDIRRFTFALDQDADFIPGQYAILHLRQDLRRCYSMCNLPGSNKLQFIAKCYEGGAGSTALAAMEPGRRITIEAPFGTCTLRKTQGRKIFVAGGTGISPILSMICDAAAQGFDAAAPLNVIYGANSPCDLAAADELAAATSRLAHGQYQPVVATPDAQWTGQRGQVTDALAALAGDPADADYYVAGPPVMVNAVKALLDEWAVPVTRVHYDSFG